MAWITPTIAAVGALINAGTSIANAGSKNQNAEMAKYGLTLDAMANARANQDLIRQLAAQTTQRGYAGYSDTQGSGITFDPVTNTWKTSLGALPSDTSNAALQSQISRNTTDARMAQYANEQALREASSYRPLADASRRAYEAYIPRTADELSGLLQGQVIDATNETTRPIVQDTLRQFARTGTAAAPVLSKIAIDAGKSIRDSIISSRIAALQNVDQMNATRRDSLRKDAGIMASLVNPTFQYANLSTNDPNNAMQNLQSAMAKNATLAGAYGTQNLNQAAANYTTAATGAAGSVPDSNAKSLATQSQGKAIGDLLSSGGVKDLASYLFSGSSGTKANEFGDLSTSTPAQLTDDRWQ